MKIQFQWRMKTFRYGGAQFGLKIKGAGAPDPSPGSTPEFRLKEFPFRSAFAWMYLIPAIVFAQIKINSHFSSSSYSFWGMFWVRAGCWAYCDCYCVRIYRECWYLYYFLLPCSLLSLFGESDMYDPLLKLKRFLHPLTVQAESSKKQFPPHFCTGLARICQDRDNAGKNIYKIAFRCLAKIGHLH